MSFPQDQIEELKRIAPSLSIAEEGGYTYIYIEKLRLPDGCNPQVVDALLCPTPVPGYNSRLYLSSQITGCPALNWNGLLRVLDRSWYAVSWRTAQASTLAATLLIHLNAFRNK